MGFLEKISGALFNRMQPDLSVLEADKRLKVASQHLSGEKGAEAKAALSEAKRISQMSNFVNEKQRLDSPEARELRLKDGTAWLNLVLISYAKQKSILVEVMDLPLLMKQVIAQEKAKRGDMPEAKQKVLDAAIFDIEKKILNIPANDNMPLMKAANDNIPSMQAANDNTPSMRHANDNTQSALDKAA